MKSRSHSERSEESQLLMKIISKKDGSQKELIEEIKAVILAGGLVVLPSDTVYGLCVDARSKSAVEKLISFKRRPAGKPISVFVGSVDRAHKYIALNKSQNALLDQLAPGPYTFVLPSKGALRPELESEQGNLGIRIPDNAFINELIDSLDFPITATSANLAGAHPHYSVESLLQSLSDKKKQEIDLIVDAGKLPYNKPSTVLDLSQETVAVLRAGDDQITETHTSTSATQTAAIGKNILTQLKEKAFDKPAIIILQGELGAGKTTLIKAIGEELGITNIVSPTYVVCYEYPTTDEHFKLFHHCDFYNIKEGDELNFLGIDQMLKPNTLVAIEWGEKSGPIFDMLTQKAQVVVVSMSYVTQDCRKIDINYL